MRWANEGHSVIASCECQCSAEHPTMKKRVAVRLADFAGNTGLHGYAYLTLPGSHLVARVFWAAVCLAGGVLSTWATIAAFRQWDKKAVITE